MRKIWISIIVLCVAALTGCGERDLADGSDVASISVSGPGLTKYGAPTRTENEIIFSSPEQIEEIMSFLTNAEAYSGPVKAIGEDYKLFIEYQDKSRKVYYLWLKDNRGSYEKVGDSENRYNLTSSDAEKLEATIEKLAEKSF